jgi:hypothetical protein
MHQLNTPIARSRIAILAVLAAMAFGAASAQAAVYRTAASAAARS